MCILTSANTSFFLVNLSPELKPLPLAPGQPIFLTDQWTLPLAPGQPLFLTDQWTASTGTMTFLKFDLSPTFYPSEWHPHLPEVPAST